MISLPVRLRLVLIVLVGVAVLLRAQVASAASDSFIEIKDIPYVDSSRSGGNIQTLDLYWKDKLKKRPVVIYMHGGGWAFGDKADVHDKPQFFSAHDMVFISMNYRLRWEYDLYDQLEDVVAVISWVRNKQAEYGLDPDRIILMGHGSGGHLASLVSTNEDYLKAAGLTLSAIRVVVAIDTASFDIPRLMGPVGESGSFLEQRLHRLVFGSTQEVWANASPITYVEAGKPIPPFALLYVAGSESTAGQTKAFAKALRDASVEVIMIPGNEKTTQSIDADLGAVGDIMTLGLIAFIHAAI